MRADYTTNINAMQGMLLYFTSAHISINVFPEGIKTSFFWIIDVNVSTYEGRLRALL